MEQGSCIENFGWTIHRNVTQLARGICVAGSNPAVPIILRGQCDYHMIVGWGKKS